MNPTQPYDLIGDIHGQHDKLLQLLKKLGYLPHGNGFRHPEGRKVVFLGDYIDRGPKVREVLMTVRHMVENQDALAILGNHEYNAICHHTPDGCGGWLRERRRDSRSGLRVTLAQFQGLECEWLEWLAWLRHLPLFLDLGGLRAVHACWDAQSLRHLHGNTLADDGFLHATAQRGSLLCNAVECVLKGPEMDMPVGRFFYDKNGCPRSRVRVRWWDVPERAQVGAMALPDPIDEMEDADPATLRQLPDYGPGEPPVFFGHYWLPPGREKAPLRPNVACLDFSAGHEGPLAAYRWGGEHTLRAEKYLTTTP